MAKITMTCKDCGVTFDVTEGEQSWYAEKGWELPKRCKKCRNAKKDSRNRGDKSREDH